MDKEKITQLAQIRSKKFKSFKILLIDSVMLVFLSGLLLAWANHLADEKIKTVLWIGVFGFVVLWIGIVALWGYVLSICPHCHEFPSSRKGSTFSIEVAGMTFGKSSQNELNPDFCGKCGKPLSEKAVEQFFRQPENLGK